MRRLISMTLIFVFVLVFIGGIGKDVGAKMSSKCKSIQSRIDRQYKEIQKLQDALAKAKSDKQRRLLEKHLQQHHKVLDKYNRDRSEAGCY